MKKRLLCYLLAVLLVLPMLLVQLPVEAGAEQQTKTRAIGIVLDNSGSMYLPPHSSAWCRATYAMEVFASMMNEGDVLQVYPMWNISLGKDGAEQDKLVINGPDEAQNIRRIYTPKAIDTPFETVTKAYEGLMATTADERYLIVLTDGEFDNMSTSEVGAQLDVYSKDLNVMFLAIGSSVDAPTVSDSTRQYYDEASDSGQVLSKLTTMSNRIFGRDELKVENGKISFDVSMSKIIVFVQGENVTDVTLSGGTVVSRHEMKYSELGAGNYPNADVDTSLQGMLLTCEDLDAGTYEVGYSGDAKSISVYYEADVDLQVQLLDEGGYAVDPSAGVYSGKYNLAYSLVDKYGQPTTSSLLGNVLYEITYSVNGQSQTVEDSKPGAIELDLAAETVLDGNFKVTYLNDYTIEKDAAALGWPNGGIAIGTRPVGQLEIRVSGGAGYYKLSELEEQAVYRVEILREGELLTGKDLDSAELTVNIENGNAIPEIRQEKDGFTVTLRYNGDATGTQCGSQCAVFTSTYTNVDGQSGQSSPIRKDYTLEDDSQALAVNLQLKQKYYLISQLDSASPIVAKLSAGGAPLSRELFDAAVVDVQIDGVECDLVPDPENSCYEIYLRKTDNIQTGQHKVTCTVNGVDAVGRPSTDEDTAQIECQNYPAWVRIVFWALLALLLLVLIWLIMNAKVLPKRIVIERCTFRVGNKEVTGDAECNFSGGGKKRGYLEINPPYFAGAPAASSCGMTLELVAVSPRRIPSAKRYIGIRGVTAGNEMYTSRMKFGGTTLVKNAEGNFVKMGTAKDLIIEDDVDSGCSVSVYSDVPGPRSRKVNVALDARLQFY